MDEGGSPRRLALLVAAVLEDLDTVLAALDAEHRAALRDLLAPSDQSPRRVLMELEELLLYADLPEAHPVSKALVTTKFAGSPDAGTASPARLVEALRLRLGQVPQQPAPAGPSPSAPPREPAAGPDVAAEPLPEFGSYEAVIDRLVGLPSLAPDEVRKAGTDPDLPELIRLPHQGAIRLPRFQFDAAGTARLAVLEVNRALGAGHDPWGAVSWWTGLHAWLERAPVDLLDEQGGPDELSRLARAEGED